MKILELFAGSRSIGKAGEELGMEVFSSDINDFEGIHYVVDIREFDPKKLPFKPDVIWASPPCTSFSVASIGRHWNKEGNVITPKTDSAVLGQQLVLRTLEIIDELKPTYWFIENPRGMLRKMPFMESLPIRHTITYCQYGDSRMKPTYGRTTHDGLLVPPVRMECLVISLRQEEAQQERKVSRVTTSAVKSHTTYVLKY